jgi:hypothetical protein
MQISPFPNPLWQGMSEDRRIAVIESREQWVHHSLGTNLLTKDALDYRASLRSGRKCNLIINFIVIRLIHIPRKRCSRTFVTAKLEPTNIKHTI